MSLLISEMKEVLEDALKAAGEIIKENFEGVFEITHKDGINNLLTEVDKLAEQRIIHLIKQAYPDHGIISEESPEQNVNSEYKWIIDPIDGTVNFAHSIPICCVSIAVQSSEGLLLGGVFNPIMNEYFFAQKGEGAFLNGRRIHVSEKKNFKTACLVTGFPYVWPQSKVHPIKVFEKFVMSGLPVRRLGSAALDLCWVACGRFDGFWEYNLNAWDIAAGYLIVEEAGGRITNFEGQPYSVFDKETLATNGHIHDYMLQAIYTEIK